MNTYSEIQLKSPNKSPSLSVSIKAFTHLTVNHRHRSIVHSIQNFHHIHTQKAFCPYINKFYNFIDVKL